MNFITALNWFIDLIKNVATWWNWLSETQFTIGTWNVSILGMFTTGFIAAVLIWKIVDLVIPV